MVICRMLARSAALMAWKVELDGVLHVWGLRRSKESLGREIREGTKTSA